MDSDRSSDGKRSNDYSTAAPYIIPAQIMDQSRNLRTMIYKDNKSQYESKVSMVDNYFVRTKYDNGSDTATQYELRPSLRPKVSNRLNLQLPWKQRVVVRRYVGEQKAIEQKVTGMFSKLFKCCVQPQIQRDYQQCDYCEHRYKRNQRGGHNNNQHQHLSQQTQQLQQILTKQQRQPYISLRRLTQREKQPIQVFYQEVRNEDIQNNRYGDQHIGDNNSRVLLSRASFKHNNNN